MATTRLKQNPQSTIQDHPINSCIHHEPGVAIPHSSLCVFKRPANYATGLATARRLLWPTEGRGLVQYRETRLANLVPRRFESRVKECGKV